MSRVKMSLEPECKEAQFFSVQVRLFLFTNVVDVVVFVVVVVFIVVVVVAVVVVVVVGVVQR